ncbi:MAG: hypothetical protein M1115_09495 [Actinobacteria bacterium]|nr:hypothetical protein [Actinomycetota bacterium]
MLVEDSIEAHVPFDLVGQAIAADQGRWLAPLADAAQEVPDELLIKAGLSAEEPHIGKQVRCDIGPARHRGAALVIPISWEATGASAIFPRLDADLEIRPLSKEVTRLTLQGGYNPPLGSAGRALDTLAFHHVAQASVHAFLSRLAEAFEQKAQEAPGPAGGNG